jgi:hypothetical protein
MPIREWSEGSDVPKEASSQFEPFSDYVSSLGVPDITAQEINDPEATEFDELSDIPPEFFEARESQEISDRPKETRQTTEQPTLSEARKEFRAIQEFRVRESVQELRTLARDLKAALVGNLSSEYEKLVGSFVDEMQKACDLVAAELGELGSEGGASQAQAQSLFSANAALQTLKQDTGDLMRRLEELEVDAATAQERTSFLKRIMRAIKRTAKALWSLISSLLTPKEWTLKGELDLPLFGNASIEIKFGA